jgi:hypothetical protein
MCLVPMAFLIRHREAENNERIAHEEADYFKFKSIRHQQLAADIVSDKPRPTVTLDEDDTLTRARSR